MPHGVIAESGPTSNGLLDCRLSAPVAASGVAAAAAASLPTSFTTPAPAVAVAAAGNDGLSNSSRAARSRMNSAGDPGTPSFPNVIAYSDGQVPLTLTSSSNAMLSSILPVFSPYTNPAPMSWAKAQRDLK